MRRALAVVVFASLAVGCGGGKSAPGAGSAGSSAGSSAAAGFDGWWEVPDVRGADDLAGGAMKLGPQELVAIAKDGRVFVRGCTTTITGASIATRDCGPALTGTLEGDTIVYPQFTVTRASTTRAAELDRLAAARRPSSDVCARALACLHAFDPNADANEAAFQLGGPAPHDPTTCAQYLEGMRTLPAEALQKPLPAECK